MIHLLACTLGCYISPFPSSSSSHSSTMSPRLPHCAATLIMALSLYWCRYFSMVFATCRTFPLSPPSFSSFRNRRPKPSSQCFHLSKSEGKIYNMTPLFYSACRSTLLNYVFATYHKKFVAYLLEHTAQLEHFLQNRSNHGHPMQNVELSFYPYGVF
jgi:hypothetical protein